jgi:nucleoside 2-deoxyribosyltransferase
MPPKLYLAGPLGFSELGKLGVVRLQEILQPFFIVINPFEHSAHEGQEIVRLENQLHGAADNAVIKSQLQQINAKIGEYNADAIRSADLVLAILDGVDVDSGTAAEIGFASALGKKVYGYRGDFRYSRDNFGAEVNLQVEYFIRASGGAIFHSLEEIARFCRTCSI